MMPTSKRTAETLLICVDNKGYPASLERRKLYLGIPDPTALKHGLVRVIDESGEDYLYPKDLFLPITVPQSLRKVILTVA